MHSTQADIEEFRRQLGKGSIQKAYKTILSFMTRLRTRFANKYPDIGVSGLYQGYLDMTYFALVPPSLKRCNLKVAIVFNYSSFRFEAWLAGRNRNVQQKYWKLLRDSHWAKYRLVTPAAGIDAIVECCLASDFDFDNPDALSSRIEKTTAAFLEDIERFLLEPERGRR